MILLDGKLVPESPPELLWQPEVAVQVFDPWSRLWFDVVSVNYIGGLFIINFHSVSPPLEVRDISILKARVKSADDQSSS